MGSSVSLHNSPDYEIAKNIDNVSDICYNCYFTESFIDELYENCELYPLTLQAFINMVFKCSNYKSIPYIKNILLVIERLNDKIYSILYDNRINFKRPHMSSLAQMKLLLVAATLRMSYARYSKYGEDTIINNFQGNIVYINKCAMYNSWNTLLLFFIHSKGDWTVEKEQYAQDILNIMPYATWDIKYELLHWINVKSFLVCEYITKKKLYANTNVLQHMINMYLRHKEDIKVKDEQVYDAFFNIDKKLYVYLNNDVKCKELLSKYKN